MGLGNRAINYPITQSPDYQIHLFIDLHRVDDADDHGVDGTVLHARRHARGAAADDEHGLADARIHGVDGDEIVSFSFAARIDWADDEQLIADQTRIFPRRHDGP